MEALNATHEKDNGTPATDVAIDFKALLAKSETPAVPGVPVAAPAVDPLAKAKAARDLIDAEPRRSNRDDVNRVVAVRTSELLEAAERIIPLLAEEHPTLIGDAEYKARVDRKRTFQDDPNGSSLVTPTVAAARVARAKAIIAKLAGLKSQEVEEEVKKRLEKRGVKKPFGQADIRAETIDYATDLLSGADQFGYADATEAADRAVDKLFVAGEKITADEGARTIALVHGAIAMGQGRERDPNWRAKARAKRKRNF